MNPILQFLFEALQGAPGPAERSGSTSAKDIDAQIEAGRQWWGGPEAEGIHSQRNFGTNVLRQDTPYSLLQKVQALEPGSDEEFLMRLQQGFNSPMPPQHQIWPNVNDLTAPPAPLQLPANDDGTWPPQRISWEPKMPQRLGGPEGTAGGFDKGALQAIIDGPMDARAFFLPGNSKSEADIFNAPLQAPKYFSMEPGRANPWSSWDTQMFPEGKQHTWQSMQQLAPMLQGDQSPVNDAEYLKLIRRMIEAARPL